MIECEITKISPPTPPTPTSPTSIGGSGSVSASSTEAIKTISKVSIFNPASWPYRVKIATIISIAILILALFLRVYFRKETNNMKPISLQSY